MSLALGSSAKFTFLSSWFQKNLESQESCSLSAGLGACHAVSFINVLLSGSCLLGQNTQDCLTSYGQSGPKEWHPSLQILIQKGQVAETLHC